MPFSFFVKLLFTYFGIYRIDPHATFVAQVEDENSISIRHCEELGDVAISFSYSFILRNPEFFTGHYKDLIQFDSTIL